MDISIVIPEEIASRMEKKEDIHSFAREAVAIEAYRKGIITEAEVQNLLGFSHRFETDAFLKKVKAYIEYDEAALQTDIDNIQKVLLK